MSLPANLSEETMPADVPCGGRPATQMLFIVLPMASMHMQPSSKRRHCVCLQMCCVVLHRCWSWLQCTCSLHAVSAFLRADVLCGNQQGDEAPGVLVTQSGEQGALWLQHRLVMYLCTTAEPWHALKAAISLGALFSCKHQQLGCRNRQSQCLSQMLCGAPCPAEEQQWLVGDST